MREFWQAELSLFQALPFELSTQEIPGKHYLVIASLSQRKSLPNDSIKLLSAAAPSQLRNDVRLCPSLRRHEFSSLFRSSSWIFKELSWLDIFFRSRSTHRYVSRSQRKQSWALFSRLSLQINFFQPTRDRSENDIVDALMREERFFLLIMIRAAAWRMVFGVELPTWLICDKPWKEVH